MKLDPYLSPCTKLKSKWIKDLNIKPATQKLIEEKVGSTLKCIGTGDHRRPLKKSEFALTRRPRKLAF